MKNIKMIEKEIRKICKDCCIVNYSINEDGSIDVNGDVDLRRLNFSTVPLLFRRVSGNFDCSYNELISLDGVPREVGGNFVCRGNMLTSLVGCPINVGGNFDCCYNQMTSLEHCPYTVGGNFKCNSNKLTSLEHCPKGVSGYFDCYDNHLTTLEHCPIEVCGDFDCSSNLLTSLEYCPFKVGDSFIIENPNDCNQRFANDISVYQIINCPTLIGGDMKTKYDFAEIRMATILNILK